MPGKPRGKSFTKNDPRINKEGRPKKIGLSQALSIQTATLKLADGTVREITGEEFLASEFANRAMSTKDPVLIRQALIMAQKEAKEAAQADSQEQELKERKLRAAAEKIEIENNVRKNRAKLREQKEEADAKIKIYKAEQEELKTKKMLGSYIDVETMRYYFSFFQRGITDSFASVKKFSKDLKRLYVAGQEREAEKKLLSELHLCFANAIKGLEEEIEKDFNENK